jgi:hypothetical protein
VADFIAANLISSIQPERYQTAVSTGEPITVQFFRDMDQTTFSDATIALQVVGTVLRVPCTYGYASRVLTITPSSPLSPSVSYEVTLVGDVNPVNDLLTSGISGIKDIAGNGMVGTFSWAFTTGTIATPTVPTLITPGHQSAIGSQPIFQWTSVTSSTGTLTYQIQVSLSNTFETIYWPLSTDLYNQTSTTIQPARSFTLNKEYWWRVRAIVTDGQGNPIPGPWSLTYNFYYGDPTKGTVTPDDRPLGLIPPTPWIVEVVGANPAPGTSNLITPPELVMAVINGQVDLGQLTETSFSLTSKAVDGVWDPNAFKPIFSPSLNGSIFGSGGITVPGPEDSYQQILVSGPLVDVRPQGVFDGTQTTLQLAVPQNYWQSNNQYTLSLNLNELQAPLTWSWTSQWAPVFSSVDDVKSTTSFFMPELVDDDIWYKIRRNSLYAIMIQVYVPTQVDGSSWIYRPPISFNPNNPPFFAREYVRIKSTLDFLNDKYRQIMTGPRTQLGDFTVDPSLQALQGNLREAVIQLKNELRPFEDKLHGHTNRGYARGAAAGRGDYMMNDNPLRHWPFGLSRRGPSFRQ